MRGLVAYRLRVELRHRWRAALGLVLLVSLLGGIVLAATAGARRTSSAYARLLAVTNPPDLLVSPPGGPGTDPDRFYQAVARLPKVRGMRPLAGLPLLPRAGTPSERLAEAMSGVGVVALLDGPGAGIARVRMVAGRLPDERRADEVLVSQRFAEAGDLEVGDHIDGVLMTAGAADIIDEPVATADQGDPIRLTVTGIGVTYDEVVPFAEFNASGSVRATSALAAMVAREYWNFEGALVDAEPNADLDALTATIEALGQDDALGTGGPVFVSNEVSAAQQVDESMQPLAIAIAVAAAVIGVVALLVVGQAVSRANREAPDEVEALRAIGTRPADRVAFAVARTAMVGAAGALGAVVVAVAVSGRFPIGVARVAEPQPGLRVDGTVLAVGAPAVAVLTVASAIPAALLGARPRSPRPKLSRLAAAAAAAGLSQAAVQGVRFAVLGGGRRPVPLRSTYVAVTAAITSILATLAFAASLVALIDTPGRYGQGWDRMVDAQFGPAPVARVIDRLATEPAVRGIAAGNYGDAVVEGVPVPAFDLAAVHGVVSVGIVEGRAAEVADEIVLGGETIDRLGARVGDTVDVDTGDGGRPMRLTGRGVFPQMGQGSFSTTGLGIGAQLGAGTFASSADVGPARPEYELEGQRYNFVAIDIDGPADALDGELAELEASIAADGKFAFVRHEQPPTKIRDLDRVRVVPAAMAGVLALVAVAALAHLLLASVRERRRDLALLRTLGFSRRQLRASVSWHAAVITAAALAVGAPLGIALGRAVWQRFASSLEASAPAETPWAWLVVVLVATLVLANLVAAVPGRSAARTSPAIILREE